MADPGVDASGIGFECGQILRRLILQPGLCKTVDVQGLHEAVEVDRALAKEGGQGALRGAAANLHLP